MQYVYPFFSVRCSHWLQHNSKAWIQSMITNWTDVVCLLFFKQAIAHLPIDVSFEPHLFTGLISKVHQTSPDVLFQTSADEVSCQHTGDVFLWLFHEVHVCAAVAQQSTVKHISRVWGTFLEVFSSQKRVWFVPLSLSWNPSYHQLMALTGCWRSDISVTIRAQISWGHHHFAGWRFDFFHFKFMQNKKKTHS